MAQLSCHFKTKQLFAGAQTRRTRNQPHSSLLHSVQHRSGPARAPVLIDQVREKHSRPPLNPNAQADLPRVVEEQPLTCNEEKGTQQKAALKRSRQAGRVPNSEWLLGPDRLHWKSLCQQQTQRLFASLNQKGVFQNQACMAGLILIAATRMLAMYLPVTDAPTV